jgi:hypothetical protein
MDEDVFPRDGHRFVARVTDNGRQTPFTINPTRSDTFNSFHTFKHIFHRLVD